MKIGCVILVIWRIDLVKRKILFITPHLPDEQSGHAGSILIYREIEKLSQNFDVTLISLCTRRELSQLNHLSHCSLVLPIIPRRIFKNPIIFKIFKIILEILNWLRFLRRNEPYWVAKYYYPHFSEELSMLNESKSFDVAIFESSMMAQYVQNVKANIKIYREHEIQFKMIEQYENYSRRYFQRKYWHRQYKRWVDFEKDIFNNFDKIVTLTDEDRRVLSKITGATNIITMPPGIVVSQLLKPAKIQHSLFFMGAFNRRANRASLNNFIENIYPKIRNQLPSVELWIIGRKPPAKYTSKLTDSITYTGFIHDIDKFLEKASIFVAPILVGSGLKMKILHAMSRALPVVTTLVGAEGIRARKGKDLIIVENNEQFVQTVVNLMQDKEKRLEIGKNAREFVRNTYSVEADVNRWENLIENLSCEL